MMECRLGPCHLSIGDGQLGSTFEDALRRADKNHASPKATSIRPVPAQRLHGPFRTAARSGFNPVSPTSYQKHANFVPETRQLCTRNIPATPSLSSATSAFRESVPLPVRPLNVASPSACSMTRYGQRHGEGLSHHRSWIGFLFFRRVFVWRRLLAFLRHLPRRPPRTSWLNGSNSQDEHDREAHHQGAL